MTEISEALGLLQEAVNEEIALANSQGAKAFELGQHDQVERQMKTSKELTAFRKKVDVLEKEYKKIGVSRKGHRAKRGSSTHQEDYYEPILTALREAGGRGRANEITDRVGEIMGAKLENETDQGRLSNGFYSLATPMRMGAVEAHKTGQAKEGFASRNMGAKRAMTTLVEKLANHVEHFNCSVYVDGRLMLFPDPPVAGNQHKKHPRRPSPRNQKRGLANREIRVERPGLLETLGRQILRGARIFSRLRCEGLLS